MLTSLLAGMVAGKGLLVVDMLAIGRLENGKWTNLVSKESDTVSRSRNIGFVELGLTWLKGKVVIPKLSLQSEVAEGWFAIDEKYSSKVLWSGTQLQFPKWKAVSPTNPVYLGVVRNHLKAKELPSAAVRINRALSVDLDADGTNEIVIEAAPYADMVPRTMEQGKATDYTAILIRWVKNGKPVTTVVSHHDARGDNVLASADQLRAITDFDGDGKFELVCSADYYEGQSAAVYSFRKGVVKKLVSYDAGV